MKKKVIIVIIIILSICLIGIIIYRSIPNFMIKNFKNIIEVNYKEEYHDNYGEVCFGNIISCKKVELNRIGTVDTNTLGEYSIEFVGTYQDKKINLKQTVKVVDKEKPIITIESEKARVCPNGKIIEAKSIATDNYDGDITSKITKKYQNNVVTITVEDSNKNRSEISMPVEVKDEEAPTITITGNKVINITQNETYKEEGAVATDNCDEVDVKITGEVDTSKVGTYTINYNASDKSGNTRK